MSLPEDDEAVHGPQVQRRHNAQRQAATYHAFLTTRGRPLVQVKEALLRALDERGLARPPAPWLDAAAAELAGGNIYVVSGPAMQDVGLELPPHRPA